MWATVRSMSLSVAVAALPALVRPGAPKPGGVGVIGDSYSDPYQFHEPHCTSAMNWVELLAQIRGLDFGPFSKGGADPGHRRGFAYNWARSGSTTADAVVDGQHHGLAAQVADGLVDLSYVFIGGNDFIEALDAEAPRHALIEAGPRAIANLREIIGTLLAASKDLRIVLATVPSIRGLPEVRDRLDAGQIDREQLGAAADALRHYNAAIRALARREARVGLADLEFEARVAERIFPKVVTVGGRRIDRLTPGNSPGNLFLADGRHIGTIGQGLIAQRFVRAAFVCFGIGIAPINHREIVAAADALALAPSPLP